MKRKIRITEEQFHKLLLNEKLGVSEDVVFAANSLKRDLRRYINEILHNSQQPLTVINGEMPFRAFYTTYKVIFTVYLTNTDEPLFQQIDLDNNIIRLAFTYIDGSFKSKDFDDGIAHELTHAFQKFKRGRSIVSDKKYSDEYEKAIYILQHPYDEDVTAELFNIAKTIYFLRNFEQDAYFHGVYSQISNELEQLDDFDESVIEDCVVNSDLSEIMSFLNHMKNNMKQESYKSTLKENFPIFRKPTQFTTKIYSLLERMNKKMNLMIKRLVYDFFEE